MTSGRNKIIALALIFGLITGGYFFFADKPAETLAVVDDSSEGIANLFQKKEFKKIYNIAYDLYSRGELTRAEGLVEKLMYQEDWKLDDKMTANCQYLKGAILVKWGKFSEALNFYYLAQKGYEKLDMPDNIFRVRNAQVRAYDYLGDQVVALRLLDQNEEMAREQGFHMAIIYNLRAQLAFTLSRWEEFCDFSKKSYDLAVKDGDLHTVAFQLSALGFGNMLKGDMEKGLELTLEAEQQFLSLGNTNGYYYNMINQVFYDRCAPKEKRSDLTLTAENMINRLQARCERDSDNLLRWYLDFVLSFDCGVIEFNAGGPDPRPE